MATKHKMTVIMIAHRLDTAVNYAEKILVMD
jgi:ABC-type multidrug transport system fused ATPase/permease subunit